MKDRGTRAGAAWHGPASRCCSGARGDAGLPPDSDQTVLDTPPAVFAVERVAADGERARVYVNVSGEPAPRRPARRRALVVAVGGPRAGGRAGRARPVVVGVAPMPIPPDYAERVYAGVLGKIIGVYLGRPFEGWTYERIVRGDRRGSATTSTTGERNGAPLVVTDDDITGTFTFLRALRGPRLSGARPDAGADRRRRGSTTSSSAARSSGGAASGNSTEHTAFLRLKEGHRGAARAASRARNGKVVAEQIGAQIFIDGWAMVAPGDPELAADLARRAASVSHDGEAIYGAQVIAAMEAHGLRRARTSTRCSTPAVR